MENKELIKRYRQYQNNLNHNIKFELQQLAEYENNPYYNEEVKKNVVIRINKTIEYLKWQLAIIREILFDIQDKRNYYFNTTLDFRLGYQL